MIKYIFVLFCFVVIGCSNKEVVLVSAKYSGDHTTAQIRGMWHICFQTRMKNMPFFPAPVHFQHCDCLVDNSRENFSSSDYDKMDKDNLTDFFRQASILCDQSTQVGKEPI